MKECCLVAGRTDNHVKICLPAVAEGHGWPGEGSDVCGRLDGGAIDCREEFGIDHRVGFEEPVIGPGEAVLPGEADGAGDAPQADKPPQP